MTASPHSPTPSDSLSYVPSASRPTGEMPAVACAPFYITGGSLPDDAPSYVERQADHDLLGALRRGQYCYVLDSRQVGKSSLMVRAAAQMRKDAARVVVLDLSGYGQNVSPEQWYFGMLFALADQLRLEDEMEAFWISHANLGLVQRWIEAIRQIALGSASGPLVIFVDEIDAVKSLPFSVDEFFAAIRECYNRRAQNPAFNRLTFCLIGVATPSELIRNPHTTPFNIGQRIVLEDFRAQEAAPLAIGLLKPGQGRRADSETPGQLEARRHALLRRVLHWTGGHPYLTQRLCQAAAERRDLRAPDDVDSVCHTLFLSLQARETDDNLTFARRRLRGDSDREAERTATLKLYDNVLRRQARVSNDPNNPLVSTLLLCGVVHAVDRRSRSVLQVRNRIYAAVFDRNWVRDNLPDAELRRLRAAVRRDLARAALFWIAAGAGVLIASWQFLNANAARLAANSYRREAAASQAKLAANARLNKALGEQAKIREAEANRKVQAANALSARSDRAARQALAQQQQTERKRDGAERKARAAYAQANTSRLSVEQTQRDLQALSSIEYSTQPGHEIEALRYGLDRVEAAWRAKRQPADFAARYLTDAVTVGKFRLLTLHQEGAVVNARFSPDDKRIVTAGGDRFAYVWEARSGRLLQKLLAQEIAGGAAADAKMPNINTVEFSPDGKTILTAGDDRQIRIWDATDPRALLQTPLFTLKPPGWTVMFNASFSHDGKRLIVSGPGNAASLWDLQTRQKLRELTGSTPHTKHVNSVAFSEDDKQIVTAGQDGTVKVWDADTGVQRADFHRHTGPVMCAIFNRWGNVVISCGQDRSIQSWNWTDPKSYEYYRSYLGHHDWVWSAARSRSGDLNYLATSGRDGIVNIGILIGTLRRFIL